MKNFYWKINLVLLYYHSVIIYFFKEDNLLINNLILDIKILLLKIK